MKPRRSRKWPPRQYNLKGKKYKLLYCRCCDLYNFKDKILLKIHKKEIAEA